MKYIVLDLEATCWQGKAKAKNETIEIGAVCINEANEQIGTYNTFIKPLKEPILSDFCTSLTSITQEMVDDAPLFDEAIIDFQKWFLGFDEAYVLCSWGFYDRNQFKSDCELHNIPTAWLNQHISLKHQYTTIKGLKRHTGMKGALWMEGFSLEGTHHRGIDDAKNIAKIFSAHFGEWKMPGENF